MDRKRYEMIVALPFVKGLIPEIIKKLPEAGLDINDFFELSIPQISKALNTSRPLEIDAYQRSEALLRARKEIEFMEKHSISALYIHDEDYPSRLSEMHNPPSVIFVLGDTMVDSDYNISIVGTRRCTQAGMDFCNRFISELSPLFPELCIVSGLAYGIDAAAHAAALNNDTKTTAVLAHGLDMIYPAANRNLAKAILNKGGSLISEYPTGVRPYQGQFLERNRLIAGLSDATIVVESEIKGGAMSTANFAFSNDRDVFAVPGRPSDIMSTGCNHLIYKDKARILCSASQFIPDMGWQTAGIKAEAAQRNLFPELQGNFKTVYDYLRYQRGPCSTDMIHNATALPISVVMSVLGELEFDGIVVRIPGNRYEISG